jgi:hypothetical protein
LLKIDANAIIIMSSGYANHPELSKLKAAGCVALIPKPYLLADDVVPFGV